MMRAILIAVGGVATILAIAGAVLPGLPTTPFLLVALWAFARSSDRLHNWLLRVPLLRHAVIEARRFEERRAIRPAIKLTALSTAWGSFLFTAYMTGTTKPVLLISIATAALFATAFMWMIPTDHGG